MSTRKKGATISSFFGPTKKSAPPAPIVDSKPTTIDVTPSSKRDQFVIRTKTRDINQAIQIVQKAKQENRPVLLQGFLADKIRSYQTEHLLLLPEDIKVASDDKSGIGFQPLRDWGIQPKRRGALPKNWGKIASIMSEKGTQTRLWTRFMDDDLKAFRQTTGHTALSEFGRRLFKCEPRSNNLIVTGSAGGASQPQKKASNGGLGGGASSQQTDVEDDESVDDVNKEEATISRAFELKSDAHQDQYDNLMLVTSGAKIWALADLSEQEIVRARKTRGKLTNSLGLDAVNRTLNRSKDEHEIAALFETVYMEAGDVLFNPSWIWHQVNSEPMTLAYSIMFPTAEQQEQEEEEEEEEAPDKENKKKGTGNTTRRSTRVRQGRP